jgi:hypothetical protein
MELPLFRVGTDVEALSHLLIYLYDLFGIVQFILFKYILQFNFIMQILIIFVESTKMSDPKYKP